MPVGEQAAGRSLGTIFYPARPTARAARGQLRHLIPRFLYGRGLSSHSDLLVRDPLIRRSGSCFDTHLVTPGEIFLPGFEAGEITAARRAAVWSRPETQQNLRPAWRIVEVLHPASQFLPVTARATRVSPGPARPDAGLPALVAAAAAKLRNAYPALQVLAQSVWTGDAHVPCPAARTVQFHGLLKGDPRRLYRPVFAKLHRILHTP